MEAHVRNMLVHFDLLRKRILTGIRSGENIRERLRDMKVEIKCQSYDITQLHVRYRLQRTALLILYM